MLALPNFTQPLVEIDASAQAIGVVLMQNGHPLAFISRTLSAKNQALSVQEIEIHGSNICS